MKKTEFNELIEKAFSLGYECALEEQREFGAKSKILGAVLPGAYQAKEAVKYAYEDDEEGYKKNRGKYALLGAFTPVTATVVKKKVEEMKKNGATPKEIKKYLKDSGLERIAGGIGEVAAGYLTGGATSGLGNLAATGVGLADVIEGNRAKFRKKDEEEEDED